MASTDLAVKVETFARTLDPNDPEECVVRGALIGVSAAIYGGQIVALRDMLSMFAQAALLDNARRQTGPKETHDTKS